MYDGRKFIVHSFDTVLGDFIEITAEVIGTMSGYDGSDILSIVYSNGSTHELSIPSFKKSIVKEIV